MGYNPSLGAFDSWRLLEGGESFLFGCVSTGRYLCSSGYPMPMRIEVHSLGLLGL